MPSTDGRIKLIIRNDDLCALSDPDRERRILSVFAKYRVPQVFGVIPSMTEDPHDADAVRSHDLDASPEMVALLKEYHAKGSIEIAQHGFKHQTNARHPTRPGAVPDAQHVLGLGQRWLPFAPANPNGYSEFVGLDKRVLRSQILAGRAILERALAVRVKTFLFPWDSLDRSSVKQVAALGFENVLCSRATLPARGLNMLGCAATDIFQIAAWISRFKGLRYPIATHFEYHSWMLDEPQIARLDALLAMLSSDREVEFTTAADLMTRAPELRRCLLFHARVNALVVYTNRWRARKLEPTPYTVIDRGFYIRQMIRYGVRAVASRLRDHRRPA